MINVKKFIEFVKLLFDKDIIHFEEFKPNLFFIDVDCLNEKSKKLAIEVSEKFIGVSSIEKAPFIDFSLHDYAFETNEDAEIFLDKIKKTKTYVLPPT